MTDELRDALAYDFRDPKRLTDALTHRSYVNEVQLESITDNERLEFLGDAVLDLVLSEALMTRFPRAREGQLSRLRARMVSEVGLARVADRIGIGRALRLGRGEELSGGREKASVLADALEAILAAVYLDGGLEPARAIILRWFTVPDEEELVESDAKTELQHRLQGARRVTPHYRLQEESGPDHDKTFVVEVLVEDEILGRGIGRSKKDAEQRAAANALAALTDDPHA